MCARLRACRSGGREINEFGVLLYVNTPEQNTTEEEKERGGRVHAQLLELLLLSPVCQKKESIKY
jgi:hypothetical protein